jgi:flagellar hook-basal body complex protein FliE
MSINAISSTPSVGVLGRVAGAQTAAAAPDFKQVLLDSIRQVNSRQQGTNLAVEHLPAGGEANPVELLTATQKADIALSMMTQIGNQLVQAYEELKSIRV